MKKINWIIYLIIVTVLIPSCFSPETITLSEADRDAKIDSLVQQRITAITPVMEEKCVRNFERYVAKAVDSLVTAHLDSTEYK